MRLLLTALALGAAPLTAAHAGAPGQTVATRADPAVAERAIKLAAMLNSDAIIVGNAKSDEEALALISQLWGSQEDLAGLEKRYPGISVALAREVMPIINRSARERLGELHRRQAALYAANFTAAELDTLIAFYGSPTGIKLIATMLASIRPNAVIAEASKSDDLRFGAESVLKDIRSAEPEIERAMDETDKAALTKLATSGLIPRLKALAPQTQTIALKWYDEEAPWEAAEIEKAMERVLARFGKKKDRS
jgi:hypothetical protein